VGVEGAEFIETVDAPIASSFKERTFVENAGVHAKTTRFRTFQ